MKSVLPLRVLLALLATPWAARAAEPVSCVPARALPLEVRIGAGEARHAFLYPGETLRVEDALTGDTLWTGGPLSAATQRFDAMTGFAGSLAALDTDGDGLHDRLYAGDLAGRLWRFDLHAGAAATAWATGGVFADFTNDAGRVFLAPPDVSLAIEGGRRWFNIAIGTAAPGRTDANNRFYLLHDPAPYESWSAGQYEEWPPLTEADLVDATTTLPDAAAIDAGWFVQLHGGDVLSAALTVAGRTVFAIAESGAAPAGCRSAFSVVTADPLTAHLAQDTTGTWRRHLADDLPADAGFVLAVGTGGEAMRASCSFDTVAVADCDVDLHARRTWWRREDAE